MEATHLPPIAHVDGDPDKPIVDYVSEKNGTITSYSLSYSSSYDGNIPAGQDWIGLPANHGAETESKQEPYYPPYYVLAYIMKT